VIGAALLGLILLGLTGHFWTLLDHSWSDRLG